MEAADYRFEGVEARIYLGCDAGATPQELSAAHNQFLALAIAADTDADKAGTLAESMTNSLLQMA